MWRLEQKENTADRCIRLWLPVLLGAFAHPRLMGWRSKPEQIFFDTVPFPKANNFRIMRLVTDGIRPDRLQSPAMDDKTWDLISNCWKANPSGRPTMEQIVNLLSV